MANEYYSWLKGWKQISIYMGRSQRTLQRWEKSAGLPVLRDFGGKPIILREHLDRWLIATSRDNFRTPGVNAALQIESEIEAERREDEERSNAHRGRY